MKDDWWFKARYNWDSAFEELSDNEIARLVRALWKYAKTGEREQLPGAERVAFAMFLRDLAEDEQISAKRKVSGAAGGSAKHRNQMMATDSNVEQTVANDSKTKQNVANVSEVSKNDSNSKSNSKSRDIYDYDTACAREEASAGVVAVRDNLANMSMSNWEELREFMDVGMTDELVCFAVAEACAHGAATWAYVRAILNEWVMNNVHSVGDAKQYGEKRKQKRNSVAGSQRTGKVVHEQLYEQREYTNDNNTLDAMMAEWGGAGK